MQITLRFFASVREAVGVGSSEHTTEVTTVGELRAELSSRHPTWQVVADEQTLAAVNQQLCDNDQTLTAGDEVAFFPFMTGG